MKRFLIIAAMIFAAIALSEASAELLMKPYLQAVTESSVIIMAESDSKIPVHAQYKSEDGEWLRAQTNFTVETEQPKKSRSDVYVHRIKLAGLNANSKYYYRVIEGSDTTKIYDFHTAARPGQKFRFAVMGDTRSNPGIHDVIAGEVLKHDPRMSIYGGDLCYNHYYSSWKNEFFVDNQQELAAGAPFYNAIGNHEGWRQNTRAFQQAPESASEKEYYYSFDYGDAHFLILSTEHDVDEGSQQWNFAKRDLENTDRKWKFVAFHIPAFCFGGHDGSDAMQKMTRQVFEPAGVDAVFTGHSHFYQHNFTGGIHHFVVAGGGAPLYSPEKAEMTVAGAKEFHYAILDVSPDKVEMTVYDMYENILDELTLEK